MNDSAATGTAAGRIIDCRNLSAGDTIEASYNGQLYYVGTVTETVPDLGMFWIHEARTRTRKLLDPLALHVVRLQSADAAPDATGGPNAEAGQ
ncbi:hypothetical protein ACFVTE_09065 [Arthrobacter sp. NPDC058097]|uniref:hypothetical protein n=1 Tax=Arthrobacter sp. NPDC058097 TaxID=3346340 RepID=UPI0036DB28C8